MRAPRSSDCAAPFLFRAGEPRATTGANASRDGAAPLGGVRDLVFFEETFDGNGRT
jgi:hypothetical protein